MANNSLDCRGKKIPDISQATITDMLSKFTKI